MADHIKINTSTLHDIGTQLGRLRDEFKHSTDLTGHYTGSMGSGDVADAMHNFASDWSKKRDQLTQGLDTLATTATQAADHWDGMDKSLADVLTKADKNGGGK
ncbi:hypothetical protein KGQ20_12285 [Catenulispora sp. NF23]|uniref:WXG100 family type VII secretion target n=1 Tax=Catenulispora pinistramenti TaxID=2705254 RepID=A0ABS5KRP9_9ACTN|nr:hypothetical protein [Catenulispora pinistramenti]MBS2533549.1 hypothetical protein [Catenulispora pinistramenti]MBS2548699.1 hypothetical protein [Catenulispora pinistramenti]